MPELPELAERLSHQQLAERARELGGYAGAKTPVPPGEIVPAGMNGTNQPLVPAAQIHPSGGPHPGPANLSDIEMRWTPDEQFKDSRVQRETQGRSPLESFAPDLIKPEQTAQNVDRYGENSAKWWESDGTNGGKR